MQTENYRPASVLTAASKLFELTLYFDDILSIFLSTFRKEHGCQTALLRIIEYRKKPIDSRNVMYTLPIDLNKAFDSFPHGVLMAKLHAYGVDLSPCKLIASNLYNRQQKYINKRRVDRFVKLRKGSTTRLRFLGPLSVNIYIYVWHFLLYWRMRPIQLCCWHPHLLEPLLIQFEWCWVKK